MPGNFPRQGRDVLGIFSGGSNYSYYSVATCCCFLMMTVFSCDRSSLITCLLYTLPSSFNPDVHIFFYDEYFEFILSFNEQTSENRRN